MRAAQTHSRTSGTVQKQARYWVRWQIFLCPLGLHTDPFLSHLDAVHATALACAFLSAIRVAALSNGKTVMVSTVRTVIADVCKTFVDARQPTDPFHDPRTRELHPDIAAQLSTGCGCTSPESPATRS